MAAVFLQLYDFFQKKRIVFWSVFLCSVTLLGLGAFKIELEEDISKFFPDDPRIENLQDVFQHSKFVERMVIMVSTRDSTSEIPDSLVSVTEHLVGVMESEMQPYVKKISSRVTDDKILEVYNTVHALLPVFLDEDDYEDLDSLTRPENIASVLRQNYRQLISPSGVALKRIIAEDPLGFSFLALRKLQQLRFDQNFELYDNYIITKDHGDLIFFIEPTYPPQETRNNAVLIQKLNTSIESLTLKHPGIKVTYFGAAAVAVGNARQLRNDSILTISIMVVLLCVLLMGFFRKKRAPFLILIPVAFGGLFSLCCIYLIKGSVSVLALGAGSIILGIAVNYALHFLVHLRHTNNVREVIKDLANPLTLGSVTTVLAFFCLQFANAAVLRDVGLFAGFSLIGAALCSLIFLPHFVSDGWFRSGHSESSHGIGTVFISKIWERRLVWSMILITPVFFYFARQVNFNSDMSKLNFMSPETHSAQVHLESINRSSLGTVYVVSRGSDLEHALRKAEQVLPSLEGLKESGTINKFSSPTLFLVSDSLQRKRLEKWNAFWTPARKQSTMRLARQEGAVLKFSEQVMQNLDSMISKSYVAGDSTAFQILRTSFFDDYFIEKEGSVSVISLVNVSSQQKESVYRHLALSSSFAVDRQMLTNLFVKYVHADFNFIVTITAILVFMALFLSYGRIELTLITFAPMFITWIWILGIMALLDIEFNIVNVMVSTFIFGLGDDYSIFIMDGLQQEYRTGRQSMSSIRTSIFLSAITTIAGLGVLILAKHPALRSIASISIIGIGCVLIMSQTIEPFLFRFLITNRTRKGLAPMTWVGILGTLFTYSYFVVTSLFLTALGFLLNLIPFGRRRIRYAFHGMIRLVNA
ncbi:MAG TPA: MMPL family transporter, partial [Chryseolinea sp.]|nr:MMPL family transporter [Chryseolinea sp.]